MVLTEIEQLLSTRLGFDIETIGLKAVAAMMKRAMEQHGFSDAATYAWVLRRDAEAWDDFVSHFVIPETWFFRDVEPFKLAAEIVRSHIGASSGRPLRILSCPCSTGEEPYSLVMAMLHAGAPVGSFSVEAVDVSRRALESAEMADFHSRSFRGEFPWDHEPYFGVSEVEGKVRLSAAAKAFVRFRQGNIITPDFLAEDAPYDVVFCRNLLIYLHAEARLRAMTALRRLVTDAGILVVGHAEAAFAREHGFKPMGPSGAFAFHKATSRPTGSTKVPESPPLKATFADLSGKTSRDQGAAESSGFHNAIALPAAASKVDSEEPAESLLATAQQLADAGQLHEALRGCSEYLRRVPDSVEGYFLLAVLHDGLGHIEVAASSFRKVLYLDPEHQEALMCLALKQEARGDRSGAALLRARAQRLAGPKT